MQESRSEAASNLLNSVESIAMSRAHELENEEVITVRSDNVGEWRHKNDDDDGDEP